MNWCVLLDVIWKSLLWVMKRVRMIVFFYGWLKRVFGRNWWILLIKFSWNGVRYFRIWIIMVCIIVVKWWDWGIWCVRNVIIIWWFICWMCCCFVWSVVMISFSVGCLSCKVYYCEWMVVVCYVKCVVGFLVCGFFYWCFICLWVVFFWISRVFVVGFVWYCVYFCICIWGCISLMNCYILLICGIILVLVNNFVWCYDCICIFSWYCYRYYCYSGLLFFEISILFVGNFVWYFFWCNNNSLFDIVSSCFFVVCFFCIKEW